MSSKLRLVFSSGKVPHPKCDFQLDIYCVRKSKYEVVAETIFSFFPYRQTR